jgi:hypothetical protein
MKNKFPNAPCIFSDEKFPKCPHENLNRQRKNIRVFSFQCTLETNNFTFPRILRATVNEKLLWCLGPTQLWGRSIWKRTQRVDKTRYSCFGETNARTAAIICLTAGISFLSTATHTHASPKSRRRVFWT